MVEKAYLQQLDANKQPMGTRLHADFNPESLSLVHQVTGPSARMEAPAPGTPSSGASAPRASLTGPRTGTSGQVTSFTSALNSVTLEFDETETGTNVRDRTKLLVQWMQPTDENRSPFILFQTGTLMFKGHITSVTETLTYFNEQGVPLRASVQLSMSESAIERVNTGSGSGSPAGLGASAGLSAGADFSAGVSAGIGVSASAGVSVGANFSAGVSANASVGTSPLTFSQSGQTVQGLSANLGVDWKVTAAVNGIENPRLLDAGTLVNLNAGASAKGRLG